LTSRAKSAIFRAPQEDHDMSNYPIWNIRRRHEWLSTPLAKKRIKRRNAKRVGLLEAMDRRKAAAPATAPEESPREDQAPPA
jgi:hypothetical protein